MVLGRPENELSVIIRHPNGSMRVNVHEVLARTGARCRCPITKHGAIVGRKSVVDYSIGKCRKLFRFMVQWLVEEDLEQVDQFISENSKKLYKEWSKQRALERR